ncbi:MAG TPA: S41 family peptidase [Pyrinomonadaceae bacterium]|nr:S41 family peptidase [Pyrinomonadaceae bacterium]
MSDKETGGRAKLREIGQAGYSMVPLAKFLAHAEKRSSLSRRERLRIVDQALQLLEMNYVHLPLKRAMHAVDPVQRLKLLKFRLETKGSTLESGMQFHKRMLEIFASLRDLHTLYLLPDPFKSQSAFLPFLIEQYFEKHGNNLIDKFLITRVVNEFINLGEGPELTHFEPGVEVLYWNGIRIKRAIEINGESQAGSNPEARFARGLDNLTIRPLETSLPPDEKWVEITYQTKHQQTLTAKFEWLVYNPDEKHGANLIHRKKRAAIDIKKTKINQLKRHFFSPTDVRVRKRFEENFYAESRKINGREFGYIRLFSFEVEKSDNFVTEFKRVITSPGFPQQGLIIDVRGNGGGRIRAGERLLQLFTPRRIKPELFEFINSPVNLEICRRDRVYQPWADSIAEAVVTGATYSLGFPITSEKECNNIGQVYYGPVILITDALSYSTTDMFAAGFQDNEIGEILGTSDNTGAGGANVWWYENFMNAVSRTSIYRFAPLPRNADLVIAMRRSIRVGRREGRPLEELGIAPDQRHYMTRRDLLNRNVDLVSRAARILATKPIYSLSAELVTDKKYALRVAATSKVRPRAKKKRIARIDIFVDGRHHKTVSAQNGAVRQATVSLDKAMGDVEWRVEAVDHNNILVAAARSR